MRADRYQINALASRHINNRLGRVICGDIRLHLDAALPDLLRNSFEISLGLRFDLIERRRAGWDEFAKKEESGWSDRPHQQDASAKLLCHAFNYGNNRLGKRRSIERHKDLIDLQVIGLQVTRS